jgi:hypothetical protein
LLRETAAVPVGAAGRTSKPLIFVDISSTFAGRLPV